METLNVIDKDSVFLEAMRVFKDASLNMLQLKNMERMSDERFLLSTDEVAKMLGGIDRKKVVRMYKDNVLKGIEDGKNIKYFYESVKDYITKLQSPSFVQDEYFSNIQNVMRRAKAPITRTEIEKFGVK